MRTLIYIALLMASGLTASRAADPVKPTFTEMERNHVRVKTPGLFANGNKLEIHLEDVPDSAYSFPLPGGKVISHYGSRGGHTGDDIKTRANDTIRSVFDGVVRMEKYYGGYGKVIVVRHPNGIETVYSHNSKDLVTTGDSVRAGQAIALTGRTGRATTEHLHFEIRINGQHFNPKLLFNMNTRELLKRTLICTYNGSQVRVVPKQAAKK